MVSRRNLRDIILILILAAFCFVGRAPVEEPVRQTDIRVTIKGLALGEPLGAGSGLTEEPMPFSQVRRFHGENVLARVARPREGVSELEGTSLEVDGRRIAELGTSREMVMHHLGRPATSKSKAPVGVVEDYYPAHDLLVRYRGYQLQKVWMQANSAAWFEAGNWPEPLSDYR